MSDEFLDANVTAIFRLRHCFYLLKPSETYFPSLEEMPNLVGRVIPFLTFALILEGVVMWLQGKRHEFRFNQAVFTWAQTPMYDGFNNLIFRSAELTVYVWVYDNFRIMTFQWDSMITWFIALMTVEFFNYWWHRCGHEIAIMWAAHELHHSSEDFNLSIAFRNNSTMRFFRWIFYVPLAPMGIPVAVMWTHVTLGALFNTFAHSALTPKLTKVIPYGGRILEFLFVTPSHHRVHHGANKYCIDKNYGQYLIIWDRMFGTFEEERDDEKITYGVLTQLQTYDVAYVQVSSFVTLWNKIKSMPTFGDKMRAIFYGPGWSPGKPRLGDPDDIPDVRGRAKWDKEIPLWINIYIIVNVVCIGLAYVNVMEKLQITEELLHLITLVYVFCGFSSIGKIFNGQRNGVLYDLMRILFFGAVVSYFPDMMPQSMKSAICWIQVLDLALLPLLYKSNYFLDSEPDKLKEH